MRTSEAPRAHLAARCAAAAVIVISLIAVVAYLRVALPSLLYPYGLEWMEGGTIDVVSRVSNGQPIYAPASLAYVPYIYAPLYYFVAAAVCLPVGVDFFGPRLVSLVSTLATALLVLRITAAHTREPLAGWAGAAVYVGCFELCGRWFHLARVDSLYVLGLALSVALVKTKRGVTGDIACGLVMAATVLTKQTGLVALAPLGVWLLFTDLRRGLRVGAIAAGTLVIVAAILELASAGQFSRYTVWIPASHPYVGKNFISFWTSDMLALLPAFAIASALVVAPWFRREPQRGLWGAVLLGFVGSAWLSRMHSGGALNTLMPAALAVSLGYGVAAGVVLQAPWAQSRRAVANGVLGGTLLAQLLVLGFPDPLGAPTTEHAQQGDRFTAYLETLPGDVLLPDYRFAQTRAGKTSYGLGMAAADLLRSDAAPEDRHELERSIAAQLAAHRFSFVVLTTQRGWISAQVKKHYCLSHRTPLAPVPVTGAPHRPQWVYRPNGDPACN